MSDSATGVEARALSALPFPQVATLAAVGIGSIGATVVLVNTTLMSFTLAAIGKIIAFILVFLMQIGIGFIMYDVATKIADKVYMTVSGERLASRELIAGVFNPLNRMLDQI